MRFRTLALATALSTTLGGLAMVTAAAASPHGGPVGGPVGGLGGVVTGGLGPGASGSAPGAAARGGGNAGFGGSIGPALGSEGRIGGGAPGLGGSFSGRSGSGFGGSIGPSLGGEHRIGGGAAGLSGGSGGSVSSNLSPNNARLNSQGSAHASMTGTAHPSDRSVLDAAQSTTQTGVTAARDDAGRSRDTAQDTTDDAKARLHRHAHDATRTAHDTDATSSQSAGAAAASARAHRKGPLHASASGAANSNLKAGLRTGAANPLGGLSAGMTVRTASGRTLGTVAKVIRGADGRVHNVLVRTGAGARRMVRLTPRDLTISGDVVTTTQTHLAAHG